MAESEPGAPRRRSRKLPIIHPPPDSEEKYANRPQQQQRQQRSQPPQRPQPQQNPQPQQSPQPGAVPGSVGVAPPPGWQDGDRPISVHMTRGTHPKYVTPFLEDDPDFQDFRELTGEEREQCLENAAATHKLMKLRERGEFEDVPEKYYLVVYVNGRYDYFKTNQLAEGWIDSVPFPGLKSPAIVRWPFNFEEGHIYFTPEINSVNANDLVEPPDVKSGNESFVHIRPESDGDDYSDPLVDFSPYIYCRLHKRGNLEIGKNVKFVVSSASDVTLNSYIPVGSRQAFHIMGIQFYCCSIKFQRKWYNIEVGHTPHRHRPILEARLSNNASGLHLQFFQHFK